MKSYNAYRTIEVKPLSGVVGAEIFGADLSADVDEAQTLMVNVAKDLAAKGEIVLSTNKGDDELIY